MKKYIILFVCLLFVNFGIFSHAMFLELIEPGVFQVEYDGGGFSPGTKVILYSDGGFTVIEEGVVDDKGFYRFDKSLEVLSAEASDGAGHVAYWEPSEEDTSTDSVSQNKKLDGDNEGVKQKRISKTKRPSKIPTVLTVLNTCALIYLIFEFRAFKRKVKK